MSIDFSLNALGPIEEDDPSSPERMITQWSEEWWALHPEVKRCVAHKRNGKQCKHAAMTMTSVCQTHGGRAPQVKMKAKQRLEEATDKNARFLLEMAADTLIPEGVRLAAIRDALDRGGLGVKSSMEIEVSAKPFERVFDRITSGASPQELPALTEHGEDEEEPGSLKARLALRAQRNEYSDIED